MNIKKLLPFLNKAVSIVKLNNDKTQFGLKAVVTEVDESDNMIEISTFKEKSYVHADLILSIKLRPVDIFKAETLCQKCGTVWFQRYGYSSCPTCVKNGCKGCGGK